MSVTTGTDDKGFQIVTIPCLRDNYAFLIHDTTTNRTALIDAPEAAPIQTVLRARGWRLDAILLTHHHDDHIQAVPALVAEFKAKVYGAAADAERLPPLGHALKPGDRFSLLGTPVEVLDVPGHTVGHIAFYLPELSAVFTGDSLMVMGCGRLFEGTPAQMYDTLQRLAALPADTMVYSGHEYTESNMRFALSLLPDDPALRARAAKIAAVRAEGGFTIPAKLSQELATNPFLRSADPAIAHAVDMDGQDPARVFAKLRSLKDSF
ncbi:hydroxyacylglutathione hydrolase [Ketogulonicigenium robustum]|uniref:Hydroxyacylglutathione hydrolase n=1 Tax=Ketogulonicigenium robustum TaxID=92947 RepID=A0A1W6NXW6_9RHOB|nr:hydroxyacylglutathione hydrolase [Ketogulonicigenium robustum]ARO14064.1 hydroxyacylglutathione hydrolase [Ketogulonicigenium robustum]